MPISHHAHQQSCQFSYHAPPQSFGHHAYQPSDLFLQLLSLLALFSVVKVTLELQMSICHRNPSASQNQVNMPLCLSLSIDLLIPISHYIYQLSDLLSRLLSHFGLFFMDCWIMIFKWLLVLPRIVTKLTFESFGVVMNNFMILKLWWPIETFPTYRALIRQFFWTRNTVFFLMFSQVWRCPPQSVTVFTLVVFFFRMCDMM